MQGTNLTPGSPSNSLVDELILQLQNSIRMMEILISLRFLNINVSFRAYFGLCMSFQSYNSQDGIHDVMMTSRKSMILYRPSIIFMKQ